MKSSTVLIAVALVFANNVSATTAPYHDPRCTAEETRHDVSNGKCEVTYACGNPPGRCEATYACRDDKGSVNVPIPGSKATTLLPCSYVSVTYWHDGKVKKQCCGAAGSQENPHHNGNTGSDPHGQQNPVGDGQHSGYGGPDIDIHIGGNKDNPQHIDPHHVEDPRQPPNIGEIREPSVQPVDSPWPNEHDDVRGYVPYGQPDHAANGHHAGYDGPEIDIHIGHNPQNVDDIRENGAHPTDNYEPWLNTHGSGTTHQQIPTHSPVHPSTHQPTHQPTHTPSHPHDNDHYTGPEIDIHITDPHHQHGYGEPYNGQHGHINQVPIGGPHNPNNNGYGHPEPIVGPSPNNPNGHGHQQPIVRPGPHNPNGYGRPEPIVGPGPNTHGKPCPAPGATGHCSECKKDPNASIHVDAKDNTRVWGCPCNQGEKPQLLPVTGGSVASAHVKNCPEIQNTIETSHGKRFKYHCGVEFTSGGKWKKIITNTYTECADKCTSGVEGPCLAMSYKIDTKECYFAHDKPSFRSVAGWITMEMLPHDTQVHCSDLTGAVRSEGGKHFKLTCNMGYQYAQVGRNVSATCIADCISKCVGEKSFVCLGAAYHITIGACYLARLPPVYEPWPDHVALQIIGNDAAAAAAAAAAQKKINDAAHAANLKHAADLAKKHAQDKKHAADKAAAAKKNGNHHNGGHQNGGRQNGGGNHGTDTSHGVVCPGVNGVRHIGNKAYHISCGRLTQVAGGSINSVVDIPSPNAIDCLNKIHSHGAQRGYWDGNPGYYYCRIPRPGTETSGHRYNVFNSPGTVLITTYRV